MAEGLTVLIVDDEPLARRRLRRLLDRIENTEIVGEAQNGGEALEQIGHLAPDVVLLDVRMPGIDGLELATQNDDLPPIIFTTAYEQYAVDAFEANAVDYLLKPIRPERLEQALAKVRDRRDEPTVEDRGDIRKMLEALIAARDGADVPRITARSGKSIRVFDPREISRFHASDRYTIFHHDGGEYLLDESLNALEERLEALGFLRVHRSELVNLHFIRELHLEEGASEVTLSDGQTAPVSRRLVGALKQKLGLTSSS